MTPAGTLFSIETNRGPRLRPAGIGAIPRDVAAWFELGPITAVDLAEKPNALSTIFRCRTGQGVFGLRRADDDGALAEARGDIIARIPAGFIRLRRGRAGYGFADETGVWCCYPWIEGACWEGRSPPFADVLQAALDLLAALARLVPPSPAVCLDRPPRRLAGWPDTFGRLAAESETAGSPFHDAVSSTAQSVLAWSRRELPAVMPAALGREGARCLTHADLNHTNILVEPTGAITALDIEDIYRDDVRFAVAHAVFKILRHAVHVDPARLEVTRAWAAGRMCEEVNTRMGRQVFADAGEVFCFAAAGAIADVGACVNFVSRGEEVWRLYDLEKRIHNIAEAALVLGCAADIQEIARLPRLSVRNVRERDGDPGDMVKADEGA